jgi:hypothetical protein
MEKGDSERLNSLPPFTEVEADVFVIEQKLLKILSCVCRSTRLTRLEILVDENSQEVLAAFKRLKTKFGGMRVIYTDCATYFASRFCNSRSVIKSVLK